MGNSSKFALDRNKPISYENTNANKININIRKKNHHIEWPEYSGQQKRGIRIQGEIKIQHEEKQPANSN